MKSKSISMLLICAVLLAAIPAVVEANHIVSHETGITLIPANAFNTSWAYYPYNVSKPFTGGSWSPNYGGTSSVLMKEVSWPGLGNLGCSIYRKLMVKNNENHNVSVTFGVSGLPSNFTVQISPRIKHLAPGEIGYGYIVITVPPGPPFTVGRFNYTITAKAGDDTSSITDAIVSFSFPDIP